MKAECMQRVDGMEVCTLATSVRELVLRLEGRLGAADQLVAAPERAAAYRDLVRLAIDTLNDMEPKAQWLSVLAERIALVEDAQRRAAYALNVLRGKEEP